MYNQRKDKFGLQKKSSIRDSDITKNISCGVVWCGVAKNLVDMIWLTIVFSQLWWVFWASLVVSLSCGHVFLQVIELRQRSCISDYLLTNNLYMRIMRQFVVFFVLNLFFFILSSNFLWSIRNTYYCAFYIFDQISTKKKTDDSSRSSLNEK